MKSSQIILAFEISKTVINGMRYFLFVIVSLFLCLGCQRSESSSNQTEVLNAEQQQELEAKVPKTINARELLGEFLRLKVEIQGNSSVQRKFDDLYRSDKIDEQSIRSLLTNYPSIETSNSLLEYELKNTGTFEGLNALYSVLVCFQLTDFFGIFPESDVFSNRDEAINRLKKYVDHPDFDFVFNLSETAQQNDRAYWDLLEYAVKHGGDVTREQAIVARARVCLNSLSLEVLQEKKKFLKKIGVEHDDWEVVEFENPFVDALNQRRAKNIDVNLCQKTLREFVANPSWLDSSTKGWRFAELGITAGARQADPRPNINDWARRIHTAIKARTGVRLEQVDGFDRAGTPMTLYDSGSNKLTLLIFGDESPFHLEFVEQIQVEINSLEIRNVRLAGIFTNSSGDRAKIQSQTTFPLFAMPWNLEIAQVWNKPNGLFFVWLDGEGRILYESFDFDLLKRMLVAISNG